MGNFGMNNGNSQNGTQGGASAASDAARQGILATQQGGRAASEALRRTSEVAADAVQRGSKAAGEAVRRNAEVLAEGQRELMQTAAQQLQQVNHKAAKAAQDTAEAMRSLAVLPNAANGGLQDMQRGVAGLIESVVQINLRAAQGMFQLADPSALIELQQRLVRDYLDTAMQGTAILVHATRRTADEALRPLEQQIEQRRQAARNQD